MNNTTYTFTVPGALTDLVRSYCRRVRTISKKDLDILSEISYGSQRNPTITAFTLISAEKDVILTAQEEITKIVNDYYTKPIYIQDTFWQRLKKLFKIYT